MVDYTALIPDATFKDDTPQNTVRRIKAILKKHGIETEERWGETGVPHCYSLRVTVAGTSFGTNGKGITKEFTLASGYGELMERLQLGYVFQPDQQKSINLALDDGINEYVDAKQLLERNRKWYSLYADRVFSRTGKVITEEALLMRYADADGKVRATPYYCINTKTREYLPTSLRKTVYSANGCAAGNTVEEALVQAISEIIERHNHIRIISEGIALPEIPEEVLKTFTIAHEIITFLRDSGFRVTVKDASLGQKFPVVCVCLVDEKTGKYHTHFGAFPNLEIALERTLTESFQGRAIERVAKYEEFCPSREASMQMKYLMNELVYGVSEKTPEFFLAVPDAYYNANMGFGGKSNGELLRECIGFFRDQGYDILVRDSSCLGFPTCQVIIPGFSEVFPHRMAIKHDDMRYRHHSVTVLRNPSAAGIEDIMGFMMHMTQRSGGKSDMTFLGEACMAANLSAAEDSYLLNISLAHIYYTLGKQEEALRHISRAVSLAPEQDASYMICLKRYLTLKKNGYNAEDVHRILLYFHGKNTVEKLYGYLEAKRNPLEPLTLHCDSKCRPECLLYGRCQKANHDALSKLINNKSKEMDHTAFRAYLDQLC